MICFYLKTNSRDILLDLFRLLNILAVRLVCHKLGAFFFTLLFLVSHIHFFFHKKSFFMERVVSRWNRLAREGMESQSLEVF